MTPSVLIYVQHLLGTGHVVRAAAIGRALRRRGCAVTMVCGNTPPPTLDTDGLTIIALPPVRASDATFQELIDEHGEPITDQWKDRRRERLLEVFDACQPDILLTETYPFGRRQLAFELKPLMEKARARAGTRLIAGSVRDILVPKADRRKEEEMAETALRYFDLILVHSDPGMVKLDDSFPFAHRVAHLVTYTGYVYLANRAEPSPLEGIDEVIVSCGGGVGALHLLRCALNARSLSTRAGGATWRLLVGHHLDEAVFSSLVSANGDGVIVERARPDFPRLLDRARLSISQAGYNTTLDVLASGVPSVLVPFAQEGESEQTMRALALAGRERVICVKETTLTPDILARAADAALALPRVENPTDMNGARASADTLIREWEKRR
ncbi:putative glycosyltransferase [Breoghania corrubedonensis]|uniref:Putative glycosyltransferase n=1 Tax=Breoghania corrubedonensis TaxID=665038 RepID=A0A2T5V1K1_9HYPH|nr:putative glycosyltransferase [Breoghania corrubedonensis]